MDDFFRLFFKFCAIRNKGWVLSMRKGSTGVGYTFETLLGKKEDSLPIPDFYGVEIKTMRIKSSNKIHLFNANPDGEYANAIERIRDRIGYPDKNNSKFIIFNFSFSGDKYYKIGRYKFGKIIVNREDNKLELVVKTIYGKDIPLNVSWSFELIQQKLRMKLLKLAIVKADNKIIDENEFFFYKWIDFYQLRDLEAFINLIELGIIKISFQINAFKSGVNEGKIYNHGTSFSISYDDIEKLYEKINIFK